MIFEDSEQEKYNGLNLNSMRELNGYQIRAGGFTWGLLPFGPAYCFGDIDLVRAMTGTPVNRMNFVLIKARPGQNLAELQAAVQARVPEGLVLQRDAFENRLSSICSSSSWVYPLAYRLLLGWRLVSSSWRSRCFRRF